MRSKVHDDLRVVGDLLSSTVTTFDSFEKNGAFGWFPLGNLFPFHQIESLEQVFDEQVFDQRAGLRLASG